MLLPESHYKKRKLENLVENQTSYTLNRAEMHVFETHKVADNVMLRFDQPVLASMLHGKKIMHLRDHESFDFLPGESLILPANELMCIDFPEARESSPTQCLAMAIDEQLIKQTITFMNETMPKADEREWSLMDYNFHFTHDPGIYQILKRLLFLFTENHTSKDYFVDNMLREEINKMRVATSENDANLRILIELQEMLTDAFEECGVSAFSPDVGSHFLKAFGVADNPKTIPASSIEDDFTIAEVIKSGLKIESLEGPDQCIDQAKVVSAKASSIYSKTAAEAQRPKN